VACLYEIVDLKNEVKAKNDVIDRLALEISQIKEKLLAKDQVVNNDSIYKILEDLKMVKERELNLMLREKIPVPFQYNFTKKPLTPTLAAQMFARAPKINTAL
jgi:hypothetical protein